MGRILGLDYGSKTVGVAVTDPLNVTAVGVEIIRRKSENKQRRTLARIEELVSEYDVEKIVLGLPLHISGDEGERAQKTREFQKKLEQRIKIPVVLIDECLTTVEADELMDELGIRGEKRKELVDEIAAVLILEDYMRNQGSSGL